MSRDDFSGAKAINSIVSTVPVSSPPVVGTTWDIMTAEKPRAQKTPRGYIPPPVNYAHPNVPKAVPAARHAVLVAEHVLPGPSVRTMAAVTHPHAMEKHAEPTPWGTPAAHAPQAWSALKTRGSARLSLPAAFPVRSQDATDANVKTVFAINTLHAAQTIGISFAHRPVNSSVRPPAPHAPQHRIVRAKNAAASAV